MSRFVGIRGDKVRVFCGTFVSQLEQEFTAKGLILCEDGTSISSNTFLGETLFLRLVTLLRIDFRGSLGMGAIVGFSGGSFLIELLLSSFVLNR
jgi:hypothetical protein